MRELMHHQTIDLPPLNGEGGVEGQIALLPQPLIRERMAELRRWIAPAHERLDHQIGASGWLDTRDGYRYALGRFYGYYLPLEAALQDAICRFRLPLDWDARRKTGRIARDLAALGLSASDIQRLPLAPTLPVLDSRAATLGCLYVVEGATLGGQMIARHVKWHLGIDEDGGAAFFSSYGADVGRRWHAFCSLLALVLQDPAAEQTIITSADTMFAGIGLWLGEGGPAAWAQQHD